MNTKLSYTYEVDSEKKTKTIVMSGEIDMGGKEDIARSLSKGQLFIPDQIGLSSLAGESENDHIWHKLDLSSVRSTNERSNAPLTTAELVDNFRGVSWDVTAATGRLYGLDVMSSKMHSAMYQMSR